MPLKFYNYNNFTPELLKIAGLGSLFLAIYLFYIQYKKYSNSEISLKLFIVGNLLNLVGFVNLFIFSLIKDIYGHYFGITFFFFGGILIIYTNHLLYKEKKIIKKKYIKSILVGVWLILFGLLFCLEWIVQFYRYLFN